MRRTLIAAVFATALFELIGCSSSGMSDPSGNGSGDGSGNGNGNADLAGVSADLSGPPPSPDLRPVTLGKSVLVFSGEGGLPGGTGSYLIPSFDELRKTVQPLGYSVVETGDWPADLLAYRAVIWTLPGATKAEGYTIPEARVTELRSYLMNGGRLVLVADRKFTFNGYKSAIAITAMNDLAVRLGVKLSFADTLPGEQTCGNISHRLGSGVNLSYNTTCGIHVAAPAAWVDCEGAAVQDYLCGEVVFVADVQTLSTSASANAQFVNNLLTVPGPQPCVR